MQEITKEEDKKLMTCMCRSGVMSTVVSLFHISIILYPMKCIYDVILHDIM